MLVKLLVYPFNGGMYGFFKSTRGSRQGKKPALFIIAQEVRNLNLAVQRGLVGSYKVCKAHFSISHLSRIGMLAYLANQINITGWNVVL